MKHRVVFFVRPPSTCVREQMLHRDSLQPIGVRPQREALENAGGTENVIIDVQLTCFHQCEDCCGGERFRQTGDAKEALQSHLLMAMTIRQPVCLREHDSLTTSISKRETWYIVGGEVCPYQAVYLTCIWP